MEDPRARARRNLLVFWLVVIGTPILLYAGCVAACAISCQAAS